LHIDDNEVFMRYCRFRGDIVVFLVYLVWDIVADFKIVGVKKNGICMCWCYHSSARTMIIRNDLEHISCWIQVMLFEITKSMIYFFQIMKFIISVFLKYYGLFLNLFRFEQEFLQDCGKYIKNAW